MDEEIGYVYKVCHLVRGVWTSASMYDEPLLEYAIGKETLPRVGKLFAFDALKEAQFWIHLPRTGFMIFKCQATNIQRAFVMLYSPTVLNVHKFWMRYRQEDNSEVLSAAFRDSARVALPPNGTVYCDSITPIEEVLV